MSQRITDPFSVIAKSPPRLTVAQAEALVRKHYGLEVTAAALLSERDQNFRLQSRDGRRYVLKIANAAEPPSVTDFQIGALMHIEKRRSCLPWRAGRVFACHSTASIMLSGS